MCQAYGLGILPWSPLAMGIVAGRYADAENYPSGSPASRRGGIYAERVTARGIEVGNQLVQLAKEGNISPPQLAVLWVKDQPGITSPLIGPRTIEQLEHFLPVIQMELDETIRLACDQLVPPGSAVANFHNSAPWMKMQVV
jgi:aryl-alcohol dehydrogenase-like predicted oxidoreductase